MVAQSWIFKAYPAVLKIMVQKRDRWCYKRKAHAGNGNNVKSVHNSPYFNPIKKEKTLKQTNMLACTILWCNLIVLYAFNFQVMHWEGEGKEGLKR